MDEVSQHHEIGEDLDVREPVQLRNPAVFHVPGSGPSIIQGEEDIIDEQEGIAEIKGRKGHRDIEEKPCAGNQKKHGNNSNPPQPDEPLEPFIKLVVE
jgi:hypothetical protein